MLGGALRASGRKILVFLSVVLMAVLILGTVMYVVEGPRPPVDRALLQGLWH
jgi:voltage-gated potassium channel